MHKKIVGSALISLLPIAIVYIPKAEQDTKILLNYNGQTSLLLSLQIYPDYYPFQFKKNQIHDFILTPSKYVVVGTDEKKAQFSQALQMRMNQLLKGVKEYGPSLWNKELYDGGLVYRNDQFWKTKKTDLLIVEQFFMDDYVDKSFINLLPHHQHKIITNFRFSRDPFTIFSEEDFKKSTSLSQSLGKYVDEYTQEYPNSLLRFGKFMKFWKQQFIDDSQNKSLIADWLNKTPPLFFKGDENKQLDSVLAELYAQSLFDKDQLQLLNSWNHSAWKAHYFTPTPVPTKIVHTHHPSLEHQIIPGTAPLSEGSQKENMIYLLHLAQALDKYAKNDDFNTTYAKDARKDTIKQALKNAKSIAKSYKSRLEKVKTYINKINPPKTLAIVTYPPTGGGGGNMTIQTISKFPFIFDIFDQPKPLTQEMDDLEHMFSVDDNGWWWNIGNTSIDLSNLKQFKGTTDNLLILATPNDWKILMGGDKPKIKAIEEIIRSDDKKSHSFYQPYHLWNEGLRSPLALNMVLDQLLQFYQQQYGTKNTETQYSEAQDWGEYWTKYFVHGLNDATE